jgi:hypothetical protein
MPFLLPWLVHLPAAVYVVPQAWHEHHLLVSPHACLASQQLCPLVEMQAYTAHHYAQCQAAGAAAAVLGLSVGAAQYHVLVLEAGLALPA